MFDILVESTKSKQGKRAGRYFFVTTMIYVVALVALGVGTVIGFSPALAEEYSLDAILRPPVPRDPSPPPAVTQHSVKSNAPAKIFAAPIKPTVIPDPKDVPSDNRQALVRTVSGLPPGGSGISGPILGSGKDDGPIPVPPPDPKPIVKPDPTPIPEVKQHLNKVSEGVLQGGAINKITPAYPQIARVARASGPVQVVVTISEEGRVLEAYAASGHPLLRATAVEAARRWTFKPTLLSNVPVKVQGMLTFNFTLQ